MKKTIKNSICALAAGALMVGCTTHQTVGIQGTPGTRIYEVSGALAGTIPSNGVLQFETSDRDAYRPFMLAEAPGSDVKVPFALDYEENARGGLIFLDVIGTIGYVSGLFQIGVGGALMADDVPGGGALMLAGAGEAILGMIMYSPDKQSAVYENREYLTSANANTDIVFQPVDLNEEAVVEDIVVEEPVKEVKTAKTSKKNTKKNDKTTSKKGGKKATKTAPAVAEPEVEVEAEVAEAAVEEPTPTPTKKGVRPGQQTVGVSQYAAGTYMVSGDFYATADDREEIGNVRLVIKAVNDSEVTVSVIEADGHDFFGEPVTMLVRRAKKGEGYLLTAKSNPKLMITIKGNRITYLNSNIPIDDQTYTLQLSGNKSK